MFTQNNDTRSNEGHDGFVWSQYLRLAYAALLAALLALAIAAPTFASGVVFFGK